MGNKMKKKGKWSAWCGALLCALCCVSVGNAVTAPEALSTAAAEETTDYEWGSVDIISIAPPFTYSIYNTASFQVYFDTNEVRTAYVGSETVSGFFMEMEHLKETGN